MFGLGNNSRGESAIWRVAFFLLGLGAIFSVFSSFAGALSDSWDAHLILGATNAFAHHRDPYLAWLNFKQGLAPDPGYESQYPPSTYGLLIPLLLLPWAIIKSLLAAANIGAAAWLILLTRRFFLPHLKLIHALFMLCAFLISTPFQYEVIHGQISLFALLAFLLSFGALKKGDNGRATLWLFIALAKFTLTLPLAFILFNRKTLGVLLSAGAGHLILWLGAAWWLGQAPMTLLAHFMEAGSYSLFAGYINYANILSGFGAAGGVTGQILSGMIILAAFAITAFRGWRDELLALALLSFVAALCVYHSSYDMMLFVFSLAYCVRTLCEGSFASHTALIRMSVILQSLTVALLWFVMEPADRLLPMLTASVLGAHRYSGQHLLALWFVFMLVVTMALGLLFAQAWRDRPRAA